MFDQTTSDLDCFPGPVAGATVADLDAWRTRLAIRSDRVDRGELVDPCRAPLRELAAIDGLDDRWSAADASDIELRAIAIAAERTRRSLDALMLHTLAELDARGVTDRDTGMRTGAWLARETNTPNGVANRRTQLAAKLRAHLPDVDAALSAGRLSIEHAQVLADAANPRIIDDFPVVAPALIDLAAQMPFTAWTREVAGIADLLDTDGGHRPNDGALSRNRLTMHRGVGHTWILRGEFTDELGLPLHEALQAGANRIFHQLQRDETTTTDLRVPAHATILAMAMAELAQLARGRDADSTTTPRPDVSLVINAADPDHITDADGTPIGDTHATTLLCDPVFRAVVTTMHGVVIALGRNQHLVNRAQRRALAHRDGGCVFPGCDRPAAWTHAHHVRHWRHGGRTDLANLASLCTHHHRVTHRNGWTMHATDDQWFWWTTPHGNTFWSQRHGRQRDGPTPASPTPASPTPGTAAHHAA